MRFSNMHTHSVFSDGKNTPEEIVRAAIDLGFTAIGFSDHSDTPCDPSYCMKTAQYPAYLREIASLRERYADKIEVLAGLELDYDSQVDREPFDYVIASVHYICEGGACYPIDHTLRQQEECIEQLCGGDRNDMAARYFERVVKHVEACRPDIVGHFDVITKFGLFDGDRPTYRRMAIEALDEVMKSCRVIEMNTGAISRGVRTLPYPADFLLRRILENGGDIILSSDSHAASTLDCFFPESVAMLKEIGFDHIVSLGKDGFRRLPI